MFARMKSSAKIAVCGGKEKPRLDKKALPTGLVKSVATGLRQEGELMKKR
jgi:hypothetical protein